MSIAGAGSGAAPTIKIVCVNNTGGTRQVGDVVAIDIEDGGADANGYNAVSPLYSAKPEGSMVWHGAIQHSVTTRTFPAGAHMEVMVVGPGKIRVNASANQCNPGDLLVRQDGLDQVLTLAGQPDLTTAVPSISAAVADGTYDTDTAALINELKADVNILAGIVGDVLVRGRAIAVAKETVTTGATGAADSLIDAHISGVSVFV